MNRFFIDFFIAIMAMFLCFSSCKKENVYKPKKQIARVLVSTNSANKQMQQAMTWDDKKLQKIDHYYNGSINWTEYYTYDKKNRICKVDDYGNNETVEYKYDGKNLKSIDWTKNGKLRESINVTYKGNKISRLEYIEYDYKKSTEANEEKHLSLIPEIVEKSGITSKATFYYDHQTLTIDIEWDGDNIVKTIYNRVLSGEYYNGEIYAPGTKTENTISTYTYDKNTNPIYGFRDGYYILKPDVYTSNIMACYSKNNLTQMTETWTMSIVTSNETLSDSDINTYNYSYTYDKEFLTGKYPTEVLYTHTYNGNTTMSTTYYEYNN